MKHMVSLAAFCQKTSWRFFSVKSLITFTKKLGQLTCWKKFKFFSKFFLKATQVVFRNSFLSFWFFSKTVSGTSLKELVPLALQLDWSHLLFFRIFFALYLNFSLEFWSMLCTSFAFFFGFVSTQKRFRCHLYASIDDMIVCQKTIP